ncbi:MAG: efflux RND transporter periplasmic adaptor subunit [Labilithrix sp.]
MKPIRSGAVLLFVAVAAAPVAPLLACKHDSASAEQTPGKGGRGGGFMRGDASGLTFAVDTFLVKAQKVDYIVQAPGTLEAFERVQVTARVAGVVDKVAFTEGQEVKTGQTLVIIDSERYALSVNSSKAALEKAQANQKDVEGQVSRREGAMQAHPGLIPGEELETYRTKTLTAKADTAVAQENLKTAQLNLRDSAVRAPMDGVIQTRTVETGQYVNAGTVMATLLRQDPMLLRFNIEPQEAPRLKPGMDADFTMRESQQAFTAKITLVAGAADPTSHMVAVTAEVAADAKKYWLRPGAFCDVSINVGASRDAPVIPRGAMRATDHGYVVYVVDENDIAAEKVVTIGMSTKDGYVEVRNGLKDGDWIVVRGGDALSPGARVKQTKYTTLDGGAPILDENAPGGGDGGVRRGRPEGNDGGRRGPRPGGSVAP